MRIHLVVNISQVVWYREQVGRQRREEAKPVEVEEVEKWEVEKILNKIKKREVVKYLVWWKEFTVEYDSYKRKKDLENVKEIVVEFEERLSTEMK